MMSSRVESRGDSRSNEISSPNNKVVNVESRKESPKLTTNNPDFVQETIPTNDSSNSKDYEMETMKTKRSTNETITTEQRPYTDLSESEAKKAKYRLNREIVYESDRENPHKPLVSLKKTSRGQYVIVERRIKKSKQMKNVLTHINSDDGYDVNNNAYSTDYVTRSNIRPLWHGATNEHYMQRYPNTDYRKLHGGINIKSKIGSLDNMEHRPNGSDVKIPNYKTNWHARSKVGSLDSTRNSLDTGSHSSFSPHQPLPAISPRYGALGSFGTLAKGHYSPRHIPVVKNIYKPYIKSKIGSLENAQHHPGGGDKKIFDAKTRYSVNSKVGSLDNSKHIPGGGDKQIFSSTINWNTGSKVGSLDNIGHIPHEKTTKVPHHKLKWNVQSKIGSLDNASHVPGGGDKDIGNYPLQWIAAPAEILMRPEGVYLSDTQFTT